MMKPDVIVPDIHISHNFSMNEKEYLTFLFKLRIKERIAVKAEEENYYLIIELYGSKN